jgi:quercetin dioxygenase-like cupin family protein
MPQTLFIDTATLPRQQMPAGGEMADILSEALAGARNVTGTLRWLTAGQAFDTGRLPRHQLLYVMEGAGTIALEGTVHAVSAGSGVYLGPDEQAIIRSDPQGGVKLFHLVVPQIPK